MFHRRSETDFIDLDVGTISVTLTNVERRSWEVDTRLFEIVEALTAEIATYRLDGDISMAQVQEEVDLFFNIQSLIQNCRVQIFQLFNTPQSVVGFTRTLFDFVRNIRFDFARRFLNM
jgi:hypothetical protein